MDAEDSHALSCPSTTSLVASDKNGCAIMAVREILFRKNQ